MKIYTKGDEIGVDFWHTDFTDADGNQITYITDNEGNWNRMKNGREELSGTLRSWDTDFWQLYSEFINGTGPEKSVFIGPVRANNDIAQSTVIRDGAIEFQRSGQPRAFGSTEYEGYITVTGQYFSGKRPNGQTNFMGSYTYSFYKLGDKTLTMAFDNKSRNSLYGVDFVNNYSRSEGAPVIYNDKNPQWLRGQRTKEMTTTYQTYIFFK